MEDGWVKRYKAYNYQKIARGEIPEEENEDQASKQQLPELDVMQVESLDEHGKLQIDDVDYNYIMSLPPLLRNRPPGLDKIEDERDKFLYDVQCRPDEADLTAYERMPLEKFGEAMLRGMGWREGMAIGKNATRAQQVKQVIPRPNRLGLGVTPQTPEKKPEGWIPKPGESRDPKPIMVLPQDKNDKVRHWKNIDEKLVPVKEPFGPGQRVFIVGGTHSGLRAVVHLKQSTNAIVILPNDEKVVVCLSDMKQIDSDDELAKLEQQHRSSKNKKDNKDKKHKTDKKRKHPSHSSSHTPSKKLKKSKNSRPSEPCWITNDIRVKICNKDLKNGEYYCKYAWIVDILPENQCTVRVEDSGAVVEGVEQIDLETFVPAKGTVKVVRGEFCGEEGTVHKKDLENEVVYVQLEDDFQIHKLEFDDVAEYRR